MITALGTLLMVIIAALALATLTSRLSARLARIAGGRAGARCVRATFFRAILLRVAPLLGIGRIILMLISHDRTPLVMWKDPIPCSLKCPGPLSGAAPSSG